jgi:DsbC/DsbD-like thiol-disulfide interchange protein
MKQTGELWLGLRFKLRDNWHIYWRNPGDSGRAVAVSWQLPEDVSVGVLKWPLPTRLPRGSYGYEEQVVLPVRLNIRPRSIREQRLPITAHVDWQVGREGCISGSATLGIALPLRGAAKVQAAEWARDIQAARATVPKAAPLTWRLSVMSQKHDLLLRVDTGSALTSAGFFPFVENQIENSAPQEAKRAGRALELRLRKSPLGRDPGSLTGVLVVPSGAVEITAVVRRWQGNKEHSTLRRRASDRPQASWARR